MQHLPHDVLIAIATQLRREHAATGHLLRFIKVCPIWYALGIPLLYGNIGLPTRSLDPFARNFVPSKYGRFVRSLSLRVGATTSLVDDNPLTHLERSWPIDNRQQSHDTPFTSVVAKYIPILRNLDNLVSFSLIIEAGASWCLLPRTTIARLIDALPETCTNLELDTHANDEQDQSLVHVCQHIRQIFPRLRNVRLRLGAMCSALFEPELNLTSGAESQSPLAKSPPIAPIQLPNIQSLVVNCGITAHGELLPQCGYEGERQLEIGAEAWCAITSTLTELVTQQAKSLKDAKILVLSPTWGLAADLSLETQLRTDMVNKTTWALPCIPEGCRSSVSGCFLIRSPDGSEQVVKNLEDIDDIAEGFVWRDVVGGARLPYHTLDAEKRDLPSFATGCVERPIADLMEHWLEVNSGVPKSRTFRNEKKTGMKLALAEKRTGHHFLALRPVKEITPDGWVRTNSNLDLEPA